LIELKCGFAGVRERFAISWRMAYIYIASYEKAKITKDCLSMSSRLPTIEGVYDGKRIQPLETVQINKKHRVLITLVTQS